MDFELKVSHYNNPSSLGGTISAEYKNFLSLTNEYILQEIISKIADKFIEQHYAEIEKELDIKVISAVSSVRMGAVVEERLQTEVSRINSIAEQALRRSKRR